MQFTHVYVGVYVGEAGSVHDMRVFRLSGFQNLCNEENFPENSHLLSDAAYSIQKFIMVPFKDNRHLTEAQIYYNTCSQARMMIERAIGLLKGRFRSLLDRLPMRRTDLVPKYVVACCISHNICLLQHDYINVPIIINGREPEINNCAVIPNERRDEETEKRNVIMYSVSIMNLI